MVFPFEREFLSLNILILLPSMRNYKSEALGYIFVFVLIYMKKFQIPSPTLYIYTKKYCIQLSALPVYTNN